MGAVALAGSVAGAFDGVTQAIVSRYVATSHPAAGACPEWQLAHLAERMVETSVHVGGMGVEDRSTTHAIARSVIPSNA
jgi:hypothetical protein